MYGKYFRPIDNLIFEYLTFIKFMVGFKDFHCEIIKKRTMSALGEILRI
jgi:hypothetical protein